VHTASGDEYDPLTFGKSDLKCQAFSLVLVDFSSPKVCAPLAENSGSMNIESHQYFKNQRKK
jgi:hypothetical protein